MMNIDMRSLKDGQPTCDLRIEKNGLLFLMKKECKIFNLDAGLSTCNEQFRCFECGQYVLLPRLPNATK